MGAFTPTGVEFIAKNLNKYLSGLGRADDAQQKLGRSAASIGKGFVGLGNNVLSFGATAGKVAVGGVGALTLATGTLGAVSLTTAASFESAFAGVLKTTDGLDDGFGNLTETGQELRQGFADLTKEIPKTFEELAAIGEIGGQLGIGKEALLEFSETVAALGVSTNLIEEEAASGLARMSNIFAVETEAMGENITRLGSTIVALGNNFATTERNILAFGERIAGAGNIAGLTRADVLAIGTAMSSVGVQAEAGGTAVQKVLLAINNAVVGTTTSFVDNTEAIDKNVDKITKLNAKLVRLEAATGLTGDQILQMREEFIAAGGTAEQFGRQLGDKNRQALFETSLALNQLTAETQILRDEQGKPIPVGQLNKFAQAAGLTSAEFQKLWNEDAGQAFQLFVEGLGKAGDNAVTILEDIGIADQRLIRSFLSLSGAGDLLGRTIELGNTAWKENTALQEEAARRYATTESQLLIFKNTLRATADIVGSRFLPFVNKVIIAGKDFVDKFSKPLANTLDNQVVPAINRLVELGSRLGSAFQTTGTAGVLATLGITPQASELISQITATIQSFSEVVTGSLTPALSGLAGGGMIDVINQGIILLNQNFEAVKGAIVGIGAVLAGGVFVALVTAIVSLATPINLIIAAAAALGAAWRSNFLGVRDVTQQAFAIISAVIGSIISSVLPPLQQAFTNITEALNNLGLTWGDVWNALGTATQIVAAAIGAVIVVLIGAIVGLVTAIAQGVATATSYWTAFQNAIALVFDGATQNIAGFIAIFRGFIRGDLTQIGTGFVLIFEGVKTSLQGIFLGIVTVISSSIDTIYSALEGFVSGATSFFESLYNTLVGNSIVPDMVNAIVEWFFRIPNALTEALGGLSEIATNLLGNLFGGGESGPTFDLSGLINGLNTTTPLIDALNQKLIEIATITIAVTLTEAVLVFTTGFSTQFNLVLLSVQAVDLALINISTITLPALLAQHTITSTAIITQLTQVNLMVITVDQSLLTIANATLPALLASSSATTAGMVSDFTSVNNILAVLIALLGEIITKFGEMGSAAAKASDTTEDKMKSAKSALEKLKQVVEQLIKKFEKLEAAARRAAEAARSAGNASGGASAASGLGFARGTLGFTVPPGYPNDTFPILTTSGEEVLVAPRGRSIEDIFAQRVAARTRPGSSSVSATSSTRPVQIGPNYVRNNSDMNRLEQTVRRTMGK